MKTTITSGCAESKIINMCDMQPTQMGWHTVAGRKILVMRTASRTRVEVMDLTNMGANSCWTFEPRDLIRFPPTRLDVELITEPVTITFNPKLK